MLRNGMRTYENSHKFSNMLSPDSTHYSFDSVQQRWDSVQLADSLCRIDSIANIDSLAKVDAVFYRAMSGFIGQSLPHSAFNNLWIFILLLGLFGLLVLTSTRSMVSIKQLIVNFFSTKERISIFSKTSIDSAEQKLIFLTYSIITFSLATTLIFSTSSINYEFSFFFKYLITISLFIIAKYLVAKYIAYVFFGNNALKALFDSYIYALFFAAFFVSIAIAIYLYGQHYIPVNLSTSTLIFTVLALLIFTIKLIQFFLHKIVVILYLLLYLCTLEIAPIIVLIELLRKIALHV